VPIEMTPEVERELRVRFLSAALAGCAEAGAQAIYATLSEAQKKQPELAAAIMADQIARAALYVLKTDRPKEEKKGGASWGS
jgi:hypothetical protein